MTLIRTSEDVLINFFELPGLATPAQAGKGMMIGVYVAYTPTSRKKTALERFFTATSYDLWYFVAKCVRTPLKMRSSHIRSPNLDYQHV
jgi:hypothetical protein